MVNSVIHSNNVNDRWRDNRPAPVARQAPHTIGGDGVIRSLLRAFELLKRMQAQGLEWEVPIASRPRGNSPRDSAPPPDSATQRRFRDFEPTVFNAAI